MNDIWLERYGSLFSKEINFVSIRHSWKKWEPKHRKVFRAKLQKITAHSTLYTSQPIPLKLQPNLRPISGPSTIGPTMYEACSSCLFISPTCTFCFSSLQHANVTAPHAPTAAFSPSPDSMLLCHAKPFSTPAPAHAARHPPPVTAPAADHPCCCCHCPCWPCNSSYCPCLHLLSITWSSPPIWL